MTHASLFSGIGGFDLAAQWCGWDNVFQVEIDPFCQKVLAKNFPEVKQYADIREFDGTPYRNAVNVLSGGFPCQPFSVAGKRKGRTDDRYLWPEMLRVISEIRPDWTVGENVAGIINMELDQVLADLEAINYETQAFVIPACAVNAPHRRDRVWIVAHNVKNAIDSRDGRRYNGNHGGGECTLQTKRPNSYASDTGCERQTEYEKQTTGIEQHVENVTDTSDKGLQGDEQRRSSIEGKRTSRPTTERSWDENWFEAAARFCGIFNGLSEWIYRTGAIKKYVKINQITGQDVSCLWQGFQSEAFQWNIGRFNTIQNKENLFTVLWQLFAKSYRQDNLLFESATIQEAFMRNVWISSKPGCTPQRWKYNEQYARKYSDSLSRLSYEIASCTAEIVDAYGKNRVDRLKSLGNAIVPQVAYQIFKAIQL